MNHLSTIPQVFVRGIVACVAFTGTAFAADPNFNDDIKPLLQQYCLKCHGDDTSEADINLQSYGTLLRGGGGGKVVEAGRSSQSLLLQAITNPDADARMPPNSPPLPVEVVDKIRTWIDSGLRETADGKSMVAARDLTFAPSGSPAAKPDGPPPMPSDLPEIEIPELLRPLPVLALDCSPWAPLSAAAGQQHVHLIDTQSEQTIGRLDFPEGEPHVIRFSRDGNVLLVAGGRPVQAGRVVLFDVRTGKRLAEIGDEIDAVLAADLSPDQRLVALGGSGRVVKVYSTTDGTQQYKLSKHTDWITSVAFSPDGKTIASGDRAGGIHLWDATSGGILLNLSEHSAAIHSLAWRGDSKLLASAGEDGKLVWWDVTDGFPAINKSNAHPPHRERGTYGTIPNGILAVCFDPRGNLASSGRDQRVRLWDQAGKQIANYPIDAGLPISLAATSDGKSIISGNSSGALQFLKTPK